MKFQRITARCPAKINRFLSVGPPDGTGYHPIRTIFQAIDVCDLLVIEPAGEPSIESNWKLPGENTISKALRLVGELGEVPPLRIRLEKRIPPESGLGGGSSDAAGLLRSLQKILIAPLPEEVLLDVAAAIGADVPFFLVGGRALAEGYGEILTPLPDADPRWLVVARPEGGGSTPEMYGKLDDLPLELRPFPEADEVYNDFERVMSEESRDLLAHLRALGASEATLCGSGSAVFGTFQLEEQARLVAAALSERAPYVWVATSLGRAESLHLDLV